MKISEIFYSIQGEGKLAGMPSVFIRTSGCNLRCTWCDTPYASWDPTGQDMTIAQILDAVKPHPTRHVVITGGEPMIQSDLPALVDRLTALDRLITLETAGTVWLDLPLHLASVSPKLANSTPHTRQGGRFAAAHDRQRLAPEILQRFGRSNCMTDIQWKFVVSQPEDVNEIQQVLDSIGNVRPQDVILMPEGITAADLASRSGWIAEICKQHGWRFGPRLHVLLYGNTRGT